MAKRGLRWYKKCVTVGLDGTNTLTAFRKSLGAEVRRGSSMTVINRDRLTELVARERALYVQQHPRSAAHYSAARNLFGRVPMTWMNKWPGGFPLYLAGARGNRITDVDGIEYIDFALKAKAAFFALCTMTLH